MEQRRMPARYPLMNPARFLSCRQTKQNTKQALSERDRYRIQVQLARSRTT
jgi:hypothetical protein